MTQARMKNPALMLPEAMQALHALDKTTHCAGLPAVTRKLVHLRASQINGCSMCVDMHSRELQKAEQADARIFCVAAWRDTPYFNEAERAALALTEALTRLSDRPDPVPSWVTAVHLFFLAWTVFTAHHPALFIGGFLFFLAFTVATGVPEA